MPHTRRRVAAAARYARNSEQSELCRRYWIAACGACGDVCVRLCVALQAHSDPWWRARGVEAPVRAALAPTWRVPVTLKC